MQIKKLIILTVIFLTSSAVHGGRFGGYLRDWCERHIVTDDPYQYEDISEAHLMSERDRLQVKQTWGQLTRSDARHLAIIRGEIERRRQIRKLLNPHPPL